MSKRVVIYTRISKDDTGEGRSNERQAEDCRKLAELRGWTVVAELADISISAYAGKSRPQWQEVMRMAELKQVDIILAWHLDRITRSMVELEALIAMAESTGVSIATVSGEIDLTNDVGRMVARILAAVARAEVERKSARQKLANEQKAAEGKPFTAGPRPLGYEDDYVTVREDEAALILKSVADIEAGASLHSIAREWREQLGNKASPTSVRFTLTNPRYAGKREYKGALYDAQWEPIFDLDTHLSLVARLKDPRQQTGVGKPAMSMLSGIARCECGARVKASKSKGRHTYRCADTNIQVNRQAADELVNAYMVAHLERPEVYDEMVVDSSDEIQSIRAEVDRLRLRMEQLSEALDGDTLTMDQFVKLNSSAKAKIEELEAQQLELSDRGLLRGLGAGTEECQERWEAASLEVKRRVIEQELEVTIHRAPANRRNVPITERMTVRVK